MGRLGSRAFYDTMVKFQLELPTFMYASLIESEMDANITCTDFWKGVGLRSS